MLSEDLLTSPLETVPEYSPINIPSSDSPSGAPGSQEMSEPDPVARPKRKHGAIPSKPQVINNSSLLYYITLNILFKSTAKISEETEERANDESGEIVTTPPGHRKSILDTLRPRSKSDAYATYKQRKPSFLAQLKLKKSKNVRKLEF